MKITTKEWLNFARDDLDVIERLLEDEHLTNMIAFHAHQVVEKSFKAVIEEFSLKMPKIHNLITLYEEVGKIYKLTLNLDNLKELNDVYISTRYPSDLGLMPYGKPTITDARIFYNFAKNCFETIKRSLAMKK